MPILTKSESRRPHVQCVREMRVGVPRERLGEIVYFYTHLVGLRPWPQNWQIPGGWGAGDPPRGVYVQFRHSPLVDPMRRRYYHDELGYNLRMTDVHAAVGGAQLGKLAKFNQARAENAAYFDAHLKGVVTPHVPQGYRHVYHQYTIQVPNGKRDGLRECLKEKEIGSEIYYPVPIHQQGFYEEMNGKVSMPVSEELATKVLSIPVHPSLTQADRELIVSTINDFMA